MQVTKWHQNMIGTEQWSQYQGYQQQCLEKVKIDYILCISYNKAMPHQTLHISSPYLIMTI